MIFLTLGISANVLLGMRESAVRRTLMNVSLSPVRMEPSVKTGSMATSASVCRGFKAPTVTLTSMNVPPNPVEIMAPVWMKWITTSVTVLQASKVLHDYLLFKFELKN